MLKVSRILGGRLLTAYAIPSILYHGGRPGYTKLTPSTFRTGIYLTDSIKMAASFGMEIYEVKVTGVSNPFVLDVQGEYYSEIPTPQCMKDEGWTYHKVDTGEIANYALDKGYDCVILQNITEGFSGGGCGLSQQTGTEYIIMNESQVQIISSASTRDILIKLDPGWRYILK